jgi:hypothetical protein
MSIVSTLGHGMVPTIFWSATGAERVLRKYAEHLDPDGCLVQQRHRTQECAAKAAGNKRPKRQKLGSGGVEATLLRKKL